MKKLNSFGSIIRTTDPAIAVTLKFVLAGLLWILLSDILLYKVGPDHILWKLAHVHILKGIFFVGITGGFLFFILHTYTQALKTKEDEIKTLFHSSPNAMALVDNNFRFYEVNDAAIRMFGFTLKEFIQLKLEDLFARDENENFDRVFGFMKSGFQKLGTWRLQKQGSGAVTIELIAQPVKGRKAFLLTFFDASRQEEMEKALSATTKVIEARIAQRTQHLERYNEELAYRASQAEHVNAELIEVNEQLQYVNKKVAAEAGRYQKATDSIQKILEECEQVVWSFSESANGNVYISPSATDLFEEAPLMTSPWFWMNYIHPEDRLIMDDARRRLEVSDQVNFMARIVTSKGATRSVLFRIHRQTLPCGGQEFSGIIAEITSISSLFLAKKLKDHKP